MALPGLGLAYLFVGKDAGLGKAQDEATSGFEKLGKYVSGVASRMGELATNTGQLMTAFEARNFDAKNSIYGVFAGMGQTAASSAKASDQLISMARKLNTMDKVPEMAEAFRELTNIKFNGGGAKDVNSMVEQLTRLSGVTGASITGLSRSLVALTNQKVSAGGITDILDSVISMGKEFGTGDTAVKNLERIVAAVRDATQKTGSDPQKFIKETSGLASIIDTFSPGKGADAAIGIMSKTQSEYDTFQKMFTGDATQLDKSTVLGALLLGSADKGFGLFKSSPLKWIQEVTKGLRDLGPASTVFKKFKKDLTTSGQGDLWRVIESELEQAGNIEKAIKASENAKGASGKMAAEHRNKYKPDEQIALNTDSAWTKFRGMFGDKQSKYVKDSTKVFNDFFKTLQEGAKTNPDLKTLSDTVSNLDKFGMKGFFGESTRSKFGALGQVLDKLGPSLDSLSKYGFKLENLFSPSGLLQTGLQALAGDFAANFMESGSFSKAMSATIEDVKKFYAKVKYYGKKVWGFLKTYWDAHGEEIKKEISEIWKELSETFGPTVSGWGESFKKTLNEFWKEYRPAFVKLGTAIGEGIQEGLKKMLPKWMQKEVSASGGGGDIVPLFDINDYLKRKHESEGPLLPPSPTKHEDAASTASTMAALKKAQSNPIFDFPSGPSSNANSSSVSVVDKLDKLIDSNNALANAFKTWLPPSKRPVSSAGSPSK
jgi:hypothetical protein